MKDLTGKASAVIACLSLLLAIAAVSVRSATIADRPLRLGLRASIAPAVLPSDIRVPASLEILATLDGNYGMAPPPLRKLKLALDQGAAVDLRGVPRCRLGRDMRRDLPTLRRTCKSAIVGGGWLRAQIVFPGDIPIPGRTRLVVANVELGNGVGRLYALAPLRRPISTTIQMPIEVQRTPRSPGLRLVLSVPPIANGFGSIDRLNLDLWRALPDLGRGGVFRLRCSDGEVALRVRGSLSDGSSLFARSPQPCRAPGSAGPQ